MTGQNTEKLILIASSTGGPKALHQLLPILNKNLDSPVVIVQHMPKGFTETLAKRLDEMCDIHVCEAKAEGFLEKGCVYIARGGFHLQICQTKEGGLYFHETQDEPVKGLRPCADVTFESVSKCVVGQILCVVLTGMGADGCYGIRKIKENGNVFTIAQDEKTCVVYGMPRAVVEKGLADVVLPLTEMGEFINKKVGVRYNGFKSIS
ncbi:MAG: CheB methylesterase domain-containing protein [Eubacteriales bacterium]|nr:CheB methylesterase domain-containing protein [Eubacteriales bacterium]